MQQLFYTEMIAYTKRLRLARATFVYRLKHFYGMQCLILYTMLQPSQSSILPQTTPITCSKFLLLCIRAARWKYLSVIERNNCFYQPSGTQINEKCSKSKRSFFCIFRADLKPSYRPIVDERRGRHNIICAHSRNGVRTPENGRQKTRSGVKV